MKNSFGEKLRTLRGPESQAEMARRIGIPQQNYQRYESGQQMAGGEQLHRISVALGVSADWLLGTVDNPQDHVPANRSPTDKDAIIADLATAVRSQQETIARLVVEKKGLWRNYTCQGWWKSCHQNCMRLPCPSLPTSSTSS